MAENHKTSVHENADRIVEWLLEHQTEFEQDGVEESSLSGSIGLSEDAAREAIDYLESHEDVARVPEATSDRPRFILKPARGWQDLAQKQGGQKHASGRM